jgi:hypothetical protein
MNNSIKKDDEKFNSLISKQHSTAEGYANSIEKSKDVIENDDEKLEDLMILQDFSNKEPIENLSIEEKYEVNIAVEQFLKKINGQMDRNIDVDSFEAIFGDSDE